MTYNIISARKINKVIKIYKPNDIVCFLNKYNKSRQEKFFVITLNTSYEEIGVHISSIGTVNKTMVHPRKIFYHAIMDNAVSIMVAYTHPSGRIEPSVEDESITKKIADSGEILVEEKNYRKPIVLCVFEDLGSLAAEVLYFVIVKYDRIINDNFFLTISLY